MNQSQFLLDTNICVFYLRGKFNVDERIDQVGWENCFISEITMLELKMGAELSLQKDGIDRSTQLNRFLSDIQILPINDAIDIAQKKNLDIKEIRLNTKIAKNEIKQANRLQNPESSLDLL